MSEMALATSSLLARMTAGAKAAMAEMTQMELPTAIRIARLPLSPANRPPTTPRPSVMAMAMAISSTNWAVKILPGLKVLDGIQEELTQNQHAETNGPARSGSTDCFPLCQLCFLHGS